MDYLREHCKYHGNVCGYSTRVWLLPMTTPDEVAALVCELRKAHRELQEDHVWALHSDMLPEALLWQKAADALDKKLEAVITARNSELRACKRKIIAQKKQIEKLLELLVKVKP